MKSIITRSGHIFMIDDSFKEESLRYKWYTMIVRNKFYAYRSENGRNVLLHRHIMGVSDKSIKVDHISGNTFDNTASNLRLATNAQNISNQPIRKNRKYKGIKFRPGSKKWQASITVNKTPVYLGSFDTDIQAAIAYDVAAIKYFGDFAFINLPERYALN